MLTTVAHRGPNPDCTPTCARRPRRRARRRAMDDAGRRPFRFPVRAVPTHGPARPRGSAQPPPPRRSSMSLSPDSLTATRRRPLDAAPIATRDARPPARRAVAVAPDGRDGAAARQRARGRDPRVRVGDRAGAGPAAARATGWPSRARSPASTSGRSPNLAGAVEAGFRQPELLEAEPAFAPYRSSSAYRIEPRARAPQPAPVRRRPRPPGVRLLRRRTGASRRPTAWSPARTTSRRSSAARP